ncbi:MAG: SDR family oxidoreductase [candidate division Zixibacteria bacterium]|nr:SDR family oxidoreductase [candidate division Zixibacteria bacterium]
MSNVLIIGATSAIAQATARLLAERGDRFVLAGRGVERLQAIADDLKVRGARDVAVQDLDLNDFERHAGLIESAWQALSGIDTVLIAHGVLPDQTECQKDFGSAANAIQTNFTSAVSLLTLLANRFEEQKHGTIAVVSSVAGDRGRQSNYVYGSTKAAKSAFLSGLRGRLHKAGVAVITIKPGFVDTPMTAQFKKGLLWAQPEAIARGIVKAIDKKKNVVYLPGFWRCIMMIVKAVPESIFKKLSV